MDVKHKANSDQHDSEVADQDCSTQLSYCWYKCSAFLISWVRLFRLCCILLLWLANMMVVLPWHDEEWFLIMKFPVTMIGYVNVWNMQDHNSVLCVMWLESFCYFSCLCNRSFIWLPVPTWDAGVSFFVHQISCCMLNVN